MLPSFYFCSLISFLFYSFPTLYKLCAILYCILLILFLCLLIIIRFLFFLFFIFFAILIMQLFPTSLPLIYLLLIYLLPIYLLPIYFIVYTITTYTLLYRLKNLGSLLQPRFFISCYFKIFLTILSFSSLYGGYLSGISSSVDFLSILFLCVNVSKDCFP